MFEQQLPCPVCGTKIPFDTKQLLAGVQFVCPNCQSSIGLAMESKPLVENAMKKLEELKQSSSK
jgi:transcription initiation factor IIE alpha subunit